MSEAESPDPLIGQTIAGKYLVESFLGGGAMGAVYRARQSALDKSVAVKVMHPEIAKDASYVARFEREARAASRLDHPNSVRVSDFGQDASGLLYLVMEFCEGRSLYDVIHQDWPLSSERVADILSQSLAAIAVAHDMGVVHRDMKPENIMVLRGKDDDGRDIDIVKVCDFGIAKLTDGDKPSSLPLGTGPVPGGPKLTTQGLVVGTPEYMSPEQAKGEPLDARSDLYSMGVILYQLLTGRTPFDGDNPLTIVVKHVTETAIAPSVVYPGVNRALEAVCIRAMQKPREARYQSARDMRSELRAAVSNTEPRMSLAFGGPPASSQARTELELTPSNPVFGGAPSSSAMAVGAAMGSAPSSVRQSNTFTPASSAAAGPPAKTSRAVLPIAIGLGFLVIGAGGAIGARAFLAARSAKAAAELTPRPEQSAASTSALGTPSVSGGAAAAPLPSSAGSAAPVAANVPTPSKDPGKRPSGVGPNTGASTTTAEVPTEVPGHVEPAVTPAPTQAPPPSATAAPAPTPAPVPPVAPFNANACTVQLGVVRSNGSVSASQFRSTDLQAPLESCFRKSLAQKNAAFSGAGSVGVDFESDHSFRGAQLSGAAASLPGLTQCVKQSVRAQLMKRGEITGEPHFDVAVNFSCP